MGISVTTLLEVKFAYLYQGTKVLRFSTFIHIQDSPVFNMANVSNSVIDDMILTFELKERFPEAESHVFSISQPDIETKKTNYISSEASRGLSNPQTGKAWHFSSQFEQ